MSLQRLKNEGVHRPFGVTLTPPQAVLAGGVITAVSGYDKEGKEGKEGTGVRVKIVRGYSFGVRGTVKGKEGEGIRGKEGTGVRVGGSTIRGTGIPLCRYRQWRC